MEAQQPELVKLLVLSGADLEKSLPLGGTPSGRPRKVVGEGGRLWSELSIGRDASWTCGCVQWGGMCLLIGGGAGLRKAEAGSLDAFASGLPHS